MKIKNLIDAMRVFASHSDDKMPAKTAYKVMRFLKTASSDERFYAQEIQKIVNDCCKRDENGEIVYNNENVVIDNDRVSECNNRIAELDDIDVAVPDIHFSIDEFDCVPMTIREMNAISDFIICVEETTE